jgi:hypothetical protein
MTNFWLKSTLIFSVLATKTFFTCSKIKLFTILYTVCVAIKNGRTKKCFPSSFGAFVGSGMDKNQDPGSGINIPDPQH